MEKIIPFEEFNLNIYDEKTNEVKEKKNFEDKLRSVKVQNNLTLYEYLNKTKRSKKSFEACRLLAICFDEFYIKVGKYDGKRNQKWIETNIEDEEWIVDPKNRLFISKESQMSKRFECERFISKEDYFDALAKEEDKRWQIYYNQNKSTWNNNRLVYTSKLMSIIEQDDLEYFEKYLYEQEPERKLLVGANKNKVMKKDNVVEIEEKFADRIKVNDEKMSKYHNLKEKESNVVSIDKKANDNDKTR